MEKLFELLELSIKIHLWLLKSRGQNYRLLLNSDYVNDIEKSYYNSYIRIFNSNNSIGVRMIFITPSEHEMSEQTYISEYNTTTYYNFDYINTLCNKTTGEIFYKDDYDNTSTENEFKLLIKYSDFFYKHILFNEEIRKRSVLREFLYNIGYKNDFDIDYGINILKKYIDDHRIK